MTENLLLREVASVDVAPGVYQAKWIKGNEKEPLFDLLDYAVALKVFINSYTVAYRRTATGQEDPSATTRVLRIPEPDTTVTTAHAQGKNVWAHETEEGRLNTFTYIITHYGIDSLLMALNGQDITAHADNGTLYMDWTGHYLFDRNYKKEK